MSGEHDPGLFALVMLLRVHGIAVEGPEVSHRLGSVKIGISEMLRCAKEFGLKSRAVSTVGVRLARTPLPAIAALNDGGDHIWPQTAALAALDAARKTQQGRCLYSSGAPLRAQSSCKTLRGAGCDTLDRRKFVIGLHPET